MMELTRQVALSRLQEELDRPPYNRWMAIRPSDVDIERREIVVSLSYRPEFSHDPHRAVFHGGVIAALADVVGHATVAIWHGYIAPTISLQLEYLAPAAGTQLLARGVLRKLGRSISRADIELTVDSKLVALGRGTFSTAPATPG